MSNVNATTSNTTRGLQIPLALCCGPRPSLRTEERLRLASRDPVAFTHPHQNVSFSLSPALVLRTDGLLPSDGWTANRANLESDQCSLVVIWSVPIMYKSSADGFMGGGLLVQLTVRINHYVLGRGTSP